jgi:hypothetical protein
MWDDPEIDDTGTDGRSTMTPSLDQATQRPLRSARLVGFVEFVFRRNDKSGDIFPTDEPHGVIAGDNPERIVVLGEANAVGLGVTRHELGMAGHVARLLASRTGHGVRWWALGVPGQRIRSLPAVVDENRELLEGADLVVLMMGVVDTLCLTNQKNWAAHMTASLDALMCTVSTDTTVLVTRIPPMDNAGSVSRLARFAAGRQARIFNAITEDIVSHHPRCTTVLFPESLQQNLWAPESREGPYVGMYSAWAASAVSGLGHCAS